MKKFLMFSAAALAAAMTFSCANLEEDIKPEIQEETPTGPRVLTLSFAAPTKTILPTGNLSETPRWQAGDKIIIYYVGEGETGSETITIPNDCTGEKYEFETKYWGEIVAIYPASAAGVNVVNNKQVPYFTVPHIQDGSFAKANICVAKTPATQRELVFHNATALLAITPPVGTTTLTVTSLGTIETNNGQRGSVIRDINNEGVSGADTRHEIVVAPPTGSILLNNDPEHLQPWYVSVYVDGSNPVLLGDLNFDNGSAMGGFAPIKLRDAYNNGRSDAAKINDIGEIIKKFPVEASKYYTLSPGYFRPYVNISKKSGKTGTKLYKWSPVNLGAETNTDAGDYFSWGEIVGHKANEGHTAFAENYKFCWANCPYSDTELMTESTPNEVYFFKYSNDDWCSIKSDFFNKLSLYDDAAFVNWGGAWRMPKLEEFGSFESSSLIIKDETQSVKGVKLKDYNDVNISIFIPAVGEGNGTDLYGYNINARYWTSDIGQQSYQHGAGKCFYDAEGSDSQFRYYGRPIRPIVNLY